MKSPRHTTTDPTELLNRIARHGVACSELELRELHRLATGLAVTSAITGLLVDTTVSPVMRERAAARTVAAIIRRPMANGPSTRPTFWAA